MLYVSSLRSHCALVAISCLLASCGGASKHENVRTGPSTTAKSKTQFASAYVPWAEAAQAYGDKLTSCIKAPRATAAYRSCLRAPRVAYVIKTRGLERRLAQIGAQRPGRCATLARRIRRLLPRLTAAFRRWGNASVAALGSGEVPTRSATRKMHAAGRATAAVQRPLVRAARNAARACP
jgi:hypothetical protein